VQSLDLAECRHLVEEAGKMQTPSEILQLCFEVATRCYGDLLG
jgi:hypothetical protein